MTTSDQDIKAMTPGNFEDLLDRFGLDLSCWPTTYQAAARAFLDQSEDARAALEEARALDAFLGLAPEGEVHSALTARILATAPGATRNADQGDGASGHLGWFAAVMRLAWPQQGWVRPAALMTASLVAGLYVGLMVPQTAPADQETDLFAYVFEVPGDWNTGEWQ